MSARGDIREGGSSSNVRHTQPVGHAHAGLSSRIASASPSAMGTAGAFFTPPALGEGFHHRLLKLNVRGVDGGGIVVTEP